MFLLYLALADTRQLPELVLGSLVAAAAASAAVGIRAARGLRGSLDPSLLRVVPAAAWSLVTESVLVLGFLLRRLAGRRQRGRFRTAPFRAGGDGPRDVARRALTESLGSLGPNTIVIGVDRDRDVVLVHQLARRDEDRDPLGLG
jgi:hypothetical protein